MWQDKKLEGTLKEAFIPMRVQPVHKGHIRVLEEVLKQHNQITIGIGSANKHNYRNPYFAIEREMMLTYDLEQMGYKEKMQANRINILQIPDFETDEEWVTYLKDNNAIHTETKIITGNPFVTKCFPNNPTEDTFQLINPIDICATDLREMIARKDPKWKEYASNGTLHYFEQFGGEGRIIEWKYEDPITYTK